MGIAEVILGPGLGDEVGKLFLHLGVSGNRLCAMAEHEEALKVGTSARG